MVFIEVRRFFIEKEEAKIFHDFMWLFVEVVQSIVLPSSWYNLKWVLCKFRDFAVFLFFSVEILNKLI